MCLKKHLVLSSGRIATESEKERRSATTVLSFPSERTDMKFIIGIMIGTPLGLVLGLYLSTRSPPSNGKQRKLFQDRRANSTEEDT